MVNSFEEYIEYMFNRDEYVAYISNISINSMGCYVMEFDNMFVKNKNMPYYSVHIIPCCLDSRSLVRFIQFIGDIIEDWTSHCSINDYDDDELVEISNSQMRKFIQLYSSSLTMPFIKLDRGIIREDKFDLYDKVTNMKELKQWAKEATSKHLANMVKYHGLR